MIAIILVITKYCINVICVTIHITGKEAISLEKHYREKFSNDDVENSFLYMITKLEALWCDVELSNFKKICGRDLRLPNELRHNLQSTTELERMFDLLLNSPFCNWLEIRILKCMAKVADVPEATQMLNIFEECVHSRKCSEVLKYFRTSYINPDHLTAVVAKLNKNAEHLIVAELIKYCYELESILQLPSDSITLVHSKRGCLEIHMVIPYYCYLHTYEMSKRSFLKLRPFNVQYIQIGTFSKVYTTNLTGTIEAKSFLADMSSQNNCKVINVVSYLFIDNYQCVAITVVVL